MNSARITFVITGMEIGGAEIVLLNLLRRIDRARFDPAVVSLSGGALLPAFEELGIPIHHLGMTRRLNPVAIKRCVATIAGTQPRLIQGWLYHGNTAALVAGLCTGVPVCWSIHNSLTTLSTEKPLSRWLIRLQATMSGWPVCINYPSFTNSQQHERMGFSSAKTTVIPNGVDTFVFHPNASARQSVRDELGVPPDTPLIGLLARWHPQKDHANFFRAAAKMATQNASVHFLLAGKEITASNAGLLKLYPSELAPRVHLLGERSDTPRLNAALDVATSSSSYGEALSISLLETMACAVPCVTTDVGDHRRLVEGAGLVVPPGNSQALARAWNDALQLSEVARAAMGQRALLRAQVEYSISQYVRRFEELFTKLVS